MRREPNTELKQEFTTIDNILSLDADAKLKLQDIKTCMNRINNILPFRVNKVSQDEVKSLIKEVHSTYADFLKLEDEGAQIRYGVEVALKLKEFKKKFNEVIKTSEDSKSIDLARGGEMVADSYLQIVYNQACGITF